MRKHLLSLALAAAATTTSLIGGGCQQKPAAAPAAAIVNLPAESFKREWGANLILKDDAVSRVIVGADTVFVYTGKNDAYALNRAGGQVRFGRHITDSLVALHDPVVLKESIVFPTDSTLEIYRPDGRPVRSYQTSSSLRTNAVGEPTGTTLFFGVDAPGAGRITAVETAPSPYQAVREAWALMAGNGVQVSAAPAVLGGTVFAGFDNGEVFAVNAETRQPVWPTSTGQTFRTSGAINADLRVDDFGVYVASTDSQLYCLDRAQGKLKWRYYAGAALRQAPAVTATTVYLPVAGRGVAAIDKVNGPEIRGAKWVVRDAVKLLAEDERYAYFQRGDNRIVAIDRATGEQRFTSKRTDLVAFGTNTTGATIYAATKAGQVLAITPVLKAGDTGELAWDDARPVGAVALR